MLGGRNLLDAAHKSVYGNELGGAQPLRIAAHRSHKESLKWVMAMLFAGEALLTWWFIFAFLIVPGVFLTSPCVFCNTDLSPLLNLVKPSG